VKQADLPVRGASEVPLSSLPPLSNSPTPITTFHPHSLSHSFFNNLLPFTHLRLPEPHLGRGKEGNDRHIWELDERLLRNGIGEQ
jgi:hypothetical protein